MDIVVIGGSVCVCVTVCVCGTCVVEYWGYF